MSHRRSGLATWALAGVSLAGVVPLWAAPPAQGSATLVIEYADRAELESALRALQAQGVLKIVKAEYPDAVTDREVAQQALAKPDPLAVSIEIVAIRYDQNDRGVFTMQSGALWRETVTTPRTQRLDPRKRYRGVITRGVLGGFRLNVEGVVREFKIEPVRAF